MDDRRDESQEHFRTLVDRVERRAGRSVRFDDWRELAHLYRVHATRLARLQTLGRDPEGVRYLNALCLRAYTLLYATPRRRRERGLFFLDDLPETLAATWRVQAAVGLLLLAAAGAGYAIASQGPTSAGALVSRDMYPPEALEQLATSAEARADFLDPRGMSAAHKSFFGGLLFVHNTKVGLLGFAVGILLGLPTLALVIYNGLMLGAFASPFVGTEQAPLFYAWILPHAVPELLAIVLCSSGGLLMGLAVVAPGRLGRRRALVVAARRAVHLVLGSIPLFVAAAGIESFVRESTLSTLARLVVGAAALSTIVAYAVGVHRLSGRRRRDEPDVSFLVGAIRADPPLESPDSGPAPAR